jgi:hypothetical protein
MNDDEVLPRDFAESGIYTYTTYDRDGRLLSVKTTNVYPIDDLMAAPYGLYVEGRWDTRDYYVDVTMTPRAIKLRPPNPTLITGTTLYNIPLPAYLRINDSGLIEVTDSTVELNFPLPGTYHIKVLTFPQVDAEFTVVVP